MSNRRLRSFCALVLMGVWGCMPSSHSVAVHGGGVVNGGTNVTLDGFWFQVGGTFIQDDSPSVIFGMAMKPGGAREFAYLVLFKHPENSVFDRVAALNAPGKGLFTMSDRLGYGSRAIDLKLEITIDRAAKTVKREHLTLDGKEVDLAKGRVFLVDLRSKTMKSEQLQARFPTNLPDPKDLIGVRSLVASVFETLPKESQAAREFLNEPNGTSDGER